MNLEIGKTSVRLCPRTGKMLSLFAQNREWLLPAPKGAVAALASGQLQEATRFTIHEAWGADECYPTVGGLPRSLRTHEHTSEGSFLSLRDHGEVWGRPCEVSVHTSVQHVCSWSLRPEVPPSLLEPLWFRLERHLQLENTSGVPRLSVTVTFPRRLALCASACSSPPLSIDALYAFHALFQMETGSRLSLLSRDSELVFQGMFPSPADPCAHKFYAQASEALLEHPGGASCRIVLHDSAQAERGLFGIWWCNNGWGDGREHRVVGIEPTTHASDGPLFGPARPACSTSHTPGNTRVFSFTLEFPP